MTKLVDSIGRTMRKLRVSLTDACNYRCFYCMPQTPAFTPRKDLLRPAEYKSICSTLVDLGIEELRVTGGEPTVRPEFREIIMALSGIGAKRLSLTSNGQLLSSHLDFLWDHGWNHLNISLDSLDPGKFERITGGGDFRAVMECIESAVAMGFTLKINAVVFKGVNDDELTGFAHWSAKTGLETRFLEFMKIGPEYGTHWRRFMCADDMIAKLCETMDLYSVPVPEDSTAIVYTSDQGAKLGFIASESKPFCGNCSRLRLSATGKLRACLMSPQGLSIRYASPGAYPALLEQVMEMKPLGRLDHVEQPMHAVGG